MMTKKTNVKSEWIKAAKARIASEGFKKVCDEVGIPPRTLRDIIAGRRSGVCGKTAARLKAIASGCKTPPVAADVPKHTHAITGGRTVLEALDDELARMRELAECIDFVTDGTSNMRERVEEALDDLEGARRALLHDEAML